MLIAILAVSTVSPWVVGILLYYGLRRVLAYNLGQVEGMLTVEVARQDARIKKQLQRDTGGTPEGQGGNRSEASELARMMSGQPVPDGWE